MEEHLLQGERGRELLDRQDHGQGRPAGGHVDALEGSRRRGAREDRPEHGVGDAGVDGQPQTRQPENDLGDQENPAAVVGVDDGTAPQRTEQQGSQLDQAHQTDDEA